MKKSILQIILLISSAMAAIAVTEDDGIIMPPKFAVAENLATEGEWSDALVLAQKVQFELPAVRDLLVVAKLELFLGDCHLELGNFEKANEKYFAARDRLARMNSPSPLLLASVFNKLGNYFDRTQEFSRATPYLDSALLIRKNTLGEEDLLVADVYNNLGSVYLNIGDFERALEYHQQAHQIRTAGSENTLELVGQSLNNMALCHHDAGELDLAMLRFKEALGVYLKSGNSAARQVAEVHLNIGNVWSDRRKFLEAKNEYEQALRLERSRNNPDQLMLATCYNNIGNMLAPLGSSAEAIEFYNKALVIKQRKLGEIHPEIAQTIFNIGVIRMYAGNYNQAKKLFDRCRISLQYDAGAEDQFGQVKDLQTLLVLMSSEMNLAMEKYQQDSNVSDLKNSFAKIEDTDHLIDYIRTHYEGRASKQRLTDLSHEIYSRALRMAFALYKETKEERYWHLGYYYSEKSRGVQLLEALQKSKAETFLGIPDDLLQELDAIEEKIVQFEKKQFLQKNQQAKVEIQRKIFEQKRQLEEKIDLISRQYPEYFQLRYETKPPTVSQLQQVLKEDQTLLTYFLGDETLWVFVINQDDFRAKEIPLKTYAVVENITSFLYSIRSLPTLKTEQIAQAIDGYSRYARSLSDFLISPIQEFLTDRITIIPDGALAFLPFEALLMDTTRQADAFKKHDYLINNFAISYNYSCRLLLEMGATKDRKLREPYIGFAPDFLPGNERGLKGLKFNGEEIQLAKETLGGTIYLADEASKNNFLKEQANHQIVHLATHGMANTEEDEYSFLAFSAEPNASEDGALLFVREIYDLKSEADIVVLSACETATGRYYQGEGIASIARGFSYAGASSLMATRWNINDRTTKDFMEMYFKKIREGGEKDLALQLTTKEFIQKASKHHAHPFYWSSFITIGNMDPVSFKSTAVNYYFWLLLILPMCLIFWMMNKKKSNPNPHS